MRGSAMLVMIGLLLGTAGSVVAENPQQEKARACNMEATEKHLKGAERRTYVKTCMAAGREAAAAKPVSQDPEKIKACNAEATSKGLKGADRKAFMKSCLAGGK